jgi:hypothetical protein
LGVTIENVRVDALKLIPVGMFDADQVSVRRWLSVIWPAHGRNVEQGSEPDPGCRPWLA